MGNGIDKRWDKEEKRGWGLKFAWVVAVFFFSFSFYCSFHLLWNKEQSHLQVHWNEIYVNICSPLIHLLTTWRVHFSMPCPAVICRMSEDLAWSILYLLKIKFDTGYFFLIRISFPSHLCVRYPFLRLRCLQCDYKEVWNQRFPIFFFEHDRKP